VPLTFRRITSDELPSFIRTTARAFLEQVEEGARDLALWPEVPRAWVAEEDGVLLGTACTLSLELTLPGGARLPMGGLSWVGVVPTARRRGILAELVDRHLRDAIDHDEPVAGLFASESSIYRRFGYGIATFGVRASIETGRAQPAPAPYLDVGGHIGPVDRRRALELLPSLHDRYRRTRAGEVSRTPDLWRAWFADEQRESPTSRPLEHVVHVDDSGEVDGALLYRVSHDDWPDSIPDVRLEVPLIRTVSDAARSALTRHVLELDLVRTVTFDGLAVEDPLRWTLAEPRQLRTRSLTDGLWLRPLDVTAVLAARRFEADADLVLEVHDPTGPAAGRYRLEITDGAAACAPTNRTPDIEVDASGLGSLVLGGVSPLTLGAAGRIGERTAGSLGRMTAAFRTLEPPSCTMAF
jgi:predicted acetyltransferase